MISVAKAYHMHGELESTDTEAERIRHNRDATLVLTWAIQNRRVIPSNIQGLVEDDRGEPFVSFINDHPDSPVTRKNFYGRPDYVVKAWLGMLGPQNDMNDAGPDLEQAYDWIADSFEDGHKPDASELGVMTDLAIELSEQEDVPAIDKIEYLKDALDFLAQQESMSRLNNDIKNLTTIQARMCQVRIDLARLEVFGEHKVNKLHAMETSDPAFKAKDREVESKSRVYLGELDEQLLGNLAAVRKMLLSPESIEGGAAGLVSGALFEAFVFRSYIASEVRRGQLTNARTRLAIESREDQGLVHNIKVSGGGMTAATNPNFDIRHDSVSPDNPAYKQTVYLQLKANPRKVNLKNIEDMNAALPDTKIFIQMSIGNFTESTNSLMKSKTQQAKALTCVDIMIENLNRS